MAFPEALAELPFKSLNDGSSDYWTSSGSGTDEYYYSPTDLDEKPLILQLDGSGATEGTVGSLSEGEWGWGDNDSIGEDTVYVRLSGGDDPDNKDAGYIECSERHTVYTVGSGNIALITSLRITNNDGNNDANIRWSLYDDSDSLLYPETLTLLSTDSGFRDTARLGVLSAGYYVTVHADLEDVAICLSGKKEAE